MKPGGDQWQVDDELLTETGRGGLFTTGYLEGDPLISYLDSDETPLFVFGSGKRGITKEREGQTDRIVPGSGYRAITAITDRRIQFVVGGGNEDGDWATDIRLADVDRVSVDGGLIREQLTISTSDRTEYHVYLKDVDTERVVTFLEDVSWAWIQVEELLDDARKQLVDAGQHEKSREYDAAKDTIASARRTLDEAASIADDLAPEAGSGIQARIDQVEGRYRETKRRVHASRATHLVDEAERSWRTDEFDRAYDQFADAREEYLTILDIYGLDPDKADAMRTRIEHVDGNLEHLSRAPLRRAKDACEQAMDADDPTDRLEHWKSALSLYRKVIELDWGREEKRFEGDVDVMRDRVAQVVGEILETRRTLTDDCCDRAENRIEAEDYTAARAAYAEGIDHLEAAIDLATEFEPAAVTDLEDRLDTLGSRVRTATTSVSEATTEPQDSPETDEQDSVETESPTGEESGPSAGESEESSTDYDDFDNWVTLAADDDDGDSDDTETGDQPTPDFDDADRPRLFDGDTEWVDRAGESTVPDGDRSMGPIERSESDLGNVLVDDPDPDQSVIDAIGVLSPEELADLTETVWTSLGWSTERVEDPIGVLASRDAPMSERTIIGVETDGTVTESTVSDLVEQRERTGADRAVLVSNVRIAPDAARTAISADVELIDVESLAGIVQREGLDNHLPDATA